MAVVRKSSAKAWSTGRVDFAKVDATTEAEIETYMIAEGENPDAPFDGYEPVRAGKGASLNAGQADPGVEPQDPSGHRKIA